MRRCIITKHEDFSIRPHAFIELFSGKIVVPERKTSAINAARSGAYYDRAAENGVVFANAFCQYAQLVKDRKRSKNLLFIPLHFNYNILTRLGMCKLTMYFNDADCLADRVMMLVRRKKVNDTLMKYKPANYTVSQ